MVPTKGLERVKGFGGSEVGRNHLFCWGTWLSVARSQGCKQGAVLGSSLVIPPQRRHQPRLRTPSYAYPLCSGDNTFPAILWCNTAATSDTPLVEWPLKGTEPAPAC